MKTFRHFNKQNVMKSLSKEKKIQKFSAMITTFLLQAIKKVYSERWFNFLFVFTVFKPFAHHVILNQCGRSARSCLKSYLMFAALEKSENQRS